jgi:hypothetical protein
MLGSPHEIALEHHDPVKLLLLPQLIQKDAVKAKQIASNAV